MLERFYKDTSFEKAEQEQVEKQKIENKLIGTYKLKEMHPQFNRKELVQKIVDKVTLEYKVSTILSLAELTDLEIYKLYKDGK